MQKNISQSNIDEVQKEAEDILKIEALKVSKHPDAKDMFRHEDKEKGFKKRYGKEVRIAVTYEGINGADIKSFNELKEYTLRFESQKRNHYAITEVMLDGDTSEVWLSYRKDGRNITNRFNRFVDAEITLADLISEE